MSVLSNLHERFAVAAKEPASTESEIGRLIAFADKNGLQLPADYLDLVREATEVEFAVKDRGLSLIHI